MQMYNPNNGISDTLFERLKNYLEICYKDLSAQQIHLSGAGDTYQLESKLSKYYGKKFALCFSNTTTALQALCIATNLRKKEIITSPINWGGSIAPFLLHDNRLVFTKVVWDSLNISVSDLSNALTAKSKCVLSVDFNGIPVDSRKIKEFCEKHELFYISDSSQSFGAYFNNKPAGFYADAIVISFSARKSIFAGEGGAVLTDCENIYEKMLWYSQHPFRQKTFLGLSNYNEYSPINGRMNPLAAIVLNEIFEVALEKLKLTQKEYFNVLTELAKQGFVEDKRSISSFNSSAYFNLVLNQKESTNIGNINRYLKNKNFLFRATIPEIKLIPFDEIFRRQFKGKYKSTKKLTLQQKKFNSKKLIRLSRIESDTLPNLSVI